MDILIQSLRLVRHVLLLESRLQLQYINFILKLFFLLRRYIVNIVVKLQDVLYNDTINSHRDLASVYFWVNLEALNG